MKRTLIIFTILLTGFTKGYSCKCNQMGIESEIDSADLIFQGIPIDKKQIDSKMIYKFSVEKVWKGNESDTISIKTGLGGPDCGMVFELGKSYVVYANHFETTYCRRNELIDSTFDDLKLDFKFASDFSNTFIYNEKRLNSKEAEYLNRQFAKEIPNYDFTDKSILFTTSMSIISKSDWIKTNWKHDSPSVELVILTEEEKIQSGYDAILVTWSKFMINDKMKSKILKQIK
ncbi:MAG: hypothetical protein WC384_20910 [Prolixibacteraceae bacterium]